MELIRPSVDLSVCQKVEASTFLAVGFSNHQNALDFKQGSTSKEALEHAALQPPFLLPESRCIGDFGDFKLLLWSIDGFCVAPYFYFWVFPISSSLSSFSAHLLSLNLVLSCFAPIQTERINHTMTLCSHSVRHWTLLPLFFEGVDSHAIVLSHRIIQPFTIRNLSFRSKSV